MPRRWSGWCALTLAIVGIFGCREQRVDSTEIAAVLPTTAPLVGATCDAATNETGNLPLLIAAETTIGGTDDYDLTTGCGAYSGSGLGPDLVYKLRVDRDCWLDVLLEPTSGDQTIYLIEQDPNGLVADCADIDTFCARYSDRGYAGDPESFSFQALVDQDYYLIVDGYNGGEGIFDLTVSGYYTNADCRLIALCDGTNDGALCDDDNTCTDEICVTGACESTPNNARECVKCDAALWEIGNLPVLLSGTTQGKDNDFNLYGEPNECDGTSVEYRLGWGRDSVHRVRVDQACDLKATLTPVDNLGFYIITDCGDVDDTCIGQADAASAGQSESINFHADPGTDYFIVVDANSTSTESPYGLQIEELTTTGCKLVCAEGEACDDGNPCTDDTCVSGACQGTPNDANSCDDGNDCTDDTCSSGDCVGADDDSNACDDGNACTSDSCSNGVCVGVEAPSVACWSCDVAPLTAGVLPFVIPGDTTGGSDNYDLSAEKYKCINASYYSTDTGSGPDAVYRVRTDRDCDLRVRMAPTTSEDETGLLDLYIVTDCLDLDASCIDVSSDNSAGSPDVLDFTATAGQDYFVIVDGRATSTLGLTAGPYDLTFSETSSEGCNLVTVCDGTNDGEPCDDENPCTTAACSSGNCVGTPDDTLTCDDGNPCTDDACNGGTCESTNDNLNTCDDGEACTDNDRCSGGTCIGDPNDTNACDDGNPCTDDACVSGACVGTADNTNTCDDGQGCTRLDRCANGTCIADDAGTAACGICDALPILRGSLPLRVVGTTLGESDDFHVVNGGVPNGCSYNASAELSDEGADIAYRFQVDAPCDLHIDLDRPDVDELSIYVVTDCGDLEGSAIDCDYYGERFVELAAEPGIDYYVVVDGYADAAGPFELVFNQDSALSCSLGFPPADCTQPGTDGEACEDNNPCTKHETCQTGACVGIPDDAAPCSDGNACTTDVCTGGACVSSNDDSNACDDGNACTDDQCISGVCTSTTDDTNACSDGIPCTDDVCQGGTCVGTAKDCSSLDDTCAIGRCHPSTGFCELAPVNEGGGCDDGDLCTGPDTCHGGFCFGDVTDCSSSDSNCFEGACNGATGACEAVPIDCSYLNANCIVGICNVGTGLCDPVASGDGTACNDGQLCTTDDVCSSGICAGTPKPCDDACNVGSCEPTSGDCIKTPTNEGGSCDDTDRCTTDDVCAEGACGGDAIDCSALDDVCLAGACDPTTGGCVAVPTTEECNDGDPCTVEDKCADGSCSGSPKLCAEFASACRTASCDPTTGNCLTTPLPDGTRCDDGDRCTTDQCVAGTCVGTPGPCAEDPDGDDPAKKGGVKGGGCSSSGGARSDIAMLLGFLLVVARRRRRTRA